MEKLKEKIRDLLEYGFESLTSGIQIILLFVVAPFVFFMFVRPSSFEAQHIAFGAVWASLAAVALLKEMISLEYRYKLRTHKTLADTMRNLIDEDMSEEKAGRLLEAMGLGQELTLERDEYAIPTNGPEKRKEMFDIRFVGDTSMVFDSDIFKPALNKLLQDCPFDAEGRRLASMSNNMILAVDKHTKCLHAAIIMSPIQLSDVDEIFEDGVGIDVFLDADHTNPENWSTCVRLPDSAFLDEDKRFTIILPHENMWEAFLVPDAEAENQWEDVISAMRAAKKKGSAGL